MRIFPTRTRHPVKMHPNLKQTKASAKQMRKKGKGQKLWAGAEGRIRTDRFATRKRRQNTFIVLKSTSANILYIKDYVMGLKYMVLFLKLAFENCY